MSSVDGAVLLRQADFQLGHREALAGCISDPRDSSRIRHETHTVLTQRDYGIALAYEDLNDHEILREDPLFQLLSGHTPDSEEAPASPPTLSTNHCAKSLTSADLKS